MVKFTTLFVAMVALAASVTTAAPCTPQRTAEDMFSSATPNKCIPETDVREYHPFNLKSSGLKSFVSKHFGDNLVVGGIHGNKDFHQLELCIVSSDYGCDANIPSNCIYENVEYRFRVNGPIEGYLKVVEDVIVIVDNFYDASGLNLYKEEGWGLRIARLNYDGSRVVFATRGAGQPLTLEAPVMNAARQWFEIVEANRYAESFKAAMPPNRCIPETDVREYHPFNLRSSNLQSFVSKEADDNVVVGGINGNKNFQQLELCIASSDYGCDANIPSNCIYENVEYRFRVNGPVKGYLKVVGDYIEIVDKFSDASGLNLYKEEGWGLRIARLNYDGSRVVFATRGAGQPLTLESQVTNAARQWFEIVEANQYAESFKAAMPPNRCIPETDVREYHPFNLRSSNLQSFVSKEADDNVVVGGVKGDKNFQQLELCIASSDYGCDANIPSNCIYENVEYRFRVNGPVKGYLKVVGDYIEIVDKFSDASGLNLYKEEGWGLRIARLNYDGSRVVFAARGAGQPLTLESQVTNAARQWFEIVEANQYARSSVYTTPNKCVGEKPWKEYHPFNLQSLGLNTPVSKQMEKNTVVGGVKGDKNFQQLELCIVSSDAPCNAHMLSNCVYENVEYRFRVEGPEQGYLRVNNGVVEIVKNFNEASGLNLYQDAGWILRVVYQETDGSKVVFAVNGPGAPLTLEPRVLNDARQMFQLIATQTYNKFSFGQWKMW